MAGHSQFSNIKYRKDAQDIKRSQKFTKFIREITVAVKQGKSAYPEFNPRLRSAIFTARKWNLPKSKIETAIKNVFANIGEEDYEEVQYEGRGPSNTAFIIHAITNNRNRTASEMRYIFFRNGGDFGEMGSVNYLFNHVGMIAYKTKVVNLEDLFNYGIELEILDIECKEGLYIIICDVKDFGKVRDAFYIRFGNPEFARLSWRAKELIKISDRKLIDKLSLLITNLEENIDIQYYESNFVLDI
ncbi:MAG: YebC/PmpR family DNA-binding transcriptional regulator [Wolbachia endosymbiont of Menacanthus eurysternus]|nr:MAG: YebC/PmpR family DNA-binding transcriptional regulator [Wolbachia endosymbiont of Menacanthus eurysternus]